MSEFKRCMTVFTYSPFKVRLLLLNMLCEKISGKSQRKDNAKP